MALSALIAAWLAGALGAVHCMAMCGGFVTAASGVSGRSAHPSLPVRPARTISAGPLVSNLGRIATYALLGALVGSAGGLLTDVLDWRPLQRSLYVVANLFLLTLALAIATRRDRFAWLQRSGAALFRKISPAVPRLRSRQGVAAKFSLGMIWGLIPCGLIYSVLPIALFAGGAWEGAAVMLAFGIGTLPNMLAAAWVLARAPRALDKQSTRYLAASLLCGFAVLGIWRALFGPLAAGQGAFCFVA